MGRTFVGVPSRVSRLDGASLGWGGCPADDEPSPLGFVSPQLVQGAVQIGTSIVSHFDSGSKGPYPLVGEGNATDQARAAKAESYLIGAVLGSVLSARLALGARQRVGASTEKALYDHKIEQMQALAPGVLAQARTLGPSFDADDGRQGLAELQRLNRGFSAPWAGHAGSDHSVLDQSTIELANQLVQLDASNHTLTRTVEDLGYATTPASGATAPPGATTPGAPGATTPVGPKQASLLGGNLTTYVVLGGLAYLVAKRL